MAFRKKQTLDYAIDCLDIAYSEILKVVKKPDDHETIDLIKPILKKIDELQNEIQEEYD